MLIADDDGGPSPWDWYPEPGDEDPPPLPVDPDDVDPDFTADLTLGGAGDGDAGTTDPDDAPGGPTPPDDDGSGNGGTAGETRNVFLPINDDFDEQNTDAQGNLIADHLPDSAAGDRLLPIDDEVLYGMLKLHSDKSNQSGRWVLNFPSAEINVWATGAAVNSPNGYRKLSSGETFEADSLPLSIAIAVEGLVASTAVDDVPLQVLFTPDGAGITITDTIMMTGWGWRMMEVDESGAASKPEHLELSHSAPIIELDPQPVTNVARSLDGRIYGTVIVSGTVDSDVADFTAGALGEFDSVDVFVNGKLARHDTIPVETVTKLTDGDSLRRPYDYSGEFGQLFSSVELEVGENVIEVRASDKVPGTTGIAEMRFSIAYDQGGQPFAGSVSCIKTQSAGTKPYLLRLDGPSAMAEKIGEIRLGNWVAPVAKGSDGKLYAGDPNTPPGVEKKPAVIEFRERVAAGEIPGQVDFKDTPEFLGGVIVGFLEGGWGMVTGGVELAGMVLDASLKYSPVALAVRWRNGDTFESEKQQLVEGMENLKTIGTVIEKIGQGQAAVIDALLSGDEEEINKLSGSARVMLEMTVELFAELMLEIDALPAYDKGKIVGRTTFEVAAVLFPVTKIGQATKLTKLKSLDDLAALPFFKTGPVGAAMAKLGKLRRYLALADEAADGKRYMSVVRAERANGDLPELNAPYKNRTWVAQTVAQRDIKYVRFYTEGTTSGPIGGWLAKAEDVAGKTPEEIRQLLALPHVPSHASHVTVPKGTKLRFGEAGPQTWPDGVPLSGGGTQVQLRSQIPKAAFDDAPKAGLEGGKPFDPSVFGDPTP